MRAKSSTKQSTDPGEAPLAPLANAGFASQSSARSRNRRRRAVRDGAMRFIVGAGGMSVILALGLIFVYLFLEVVPLLLPAKANHEVSYPAPTTVVDAQNRAPTIHVAIERYREVGVRFGADGEVVFLQVQTGEILKVERLPIPEAVEISSVGIAEPRTRLLGFGLSDGSIILVQHEYELAYPNDERVITPLLSYPFGEEPIRVDDLGSAITTIGVQRGPGGSVAAAIATKNGQLQVLLFSVTQTLFDSEMKRKSFELTPPAAPIRQCLLSADLHDLLVLDERGVLHQYDISRPSHASRTHSVSVLDEGVRVTAVDYLLGTVSLIVGGSDGSVAQWMMVRDDQNIRRLQFVRSFEPHNSAVTLIAPEHSRKGFLTADESGRAAIHFATSDQTLLSTRLSDAPVAAASFAPSANGLIAIDSTEQLHYFDVKNPHPQASLSALWSQVWYEGYDEPQYRWESSSGTDEFEPKLSLVPLTIGTIKAAFYAMLFATPLAIMGAIYSAYFMTPRMRGLVKPSIEIMEALPTVILGFLAGLWFAPFVENHLPAVFTVLIGLPTAIIAMSLLWSAAPAAVRVIVPAGWEAAVLIPVVVAVGWACVAMSPLIEVWFFNGSMRQWFTDVGITYDQRNAMIVGVAMGFAVIPTIFSIAEDAIFNVPRHMTQGSLALGATPWQTMIRIVLLTASPGIFSAVMIGLGRAVGETMIVLMATGNSPVTNFNIFEGMRTLSANIAVEMPETEVGGTHYRILFLSAFVLLILTFAFNTVAEIVRQRLRRKYSSL